ncbi:MAG: zinc-binding dehydrogenase [Eubacteriales bacterium]|jgi:threonine dehydrogenase-like Zn-dependent dehydrogenase|nr:zinc-binding dehydrogenase [Eubacteriales bacterium]MDD3109979.1 zinc-binding dehydrogenase [Eubacteriales bacterium]NLO13963.1 alcohol dehydrogenase catalytic domain-containing protein [Clostridiales bacterium]
MTITPKGFFGRKGFELDLRALSVRPLGAHGVRIRVLACGVCGTDLHFLRDSVDYAPLGHEVCGQVLETGAAVTRFVPGQQVVMEDVALCGTCDQCKSGRVDLCRSGFTMQDQPGMAEEIVLHENMLHDASGLDPVFAAMTEPLAVAIRCVEALGPDPGKPLAIFGMGTIGLFCAAYAHFRGAGPITMIARDPESQRNKAAWEAARGLGAQQAFYTSEKGWMEGIGFFPSVILAAPPSLAAQALKLAAYGGRVLACGVTLGEGKTAELDVNDMVWNKKSLLTSIAEPGLHFPLALSLIRSGRIDAGRVVTHQLPLGEAWELARLYGTDKPAVKTVIIPG